MRFLYFGTDPSLFPLKGEVIHFPLIKIVPLNKDTILKTIGSLDRYTHLVFTSKNSVKLWTALGFDHTKHVVIAIGKVTASYLKRVDHIAKDERQEGIAEILCTLKLNNAHLLFPQSLQARPFLKEFLEMKGIVATFCPIYRTECSDLKEMPSLSDFEALVLTSPSCVRAFANQIEEIPSHVQVFVQGKITKEEVIRLFKNQKVSMIDGKKQISC